MRKVSHLALGLSALVFSGVSLSAQEYSFGGQVSAALPAGPLSSKDWLDGKPGAGIGAHMVIGFQGGHAVVPRIDYTYFKKSESGVDRKVQMYQIGADYNYFLHGKVNEGPYLGAGLGFGSAKFELTGHGAFLERHPQLRLQLGGGRLDVHQELRHRTALHLEPLQARGGRFRPPGLHRQAHRGRAGHQCELHLPVLNWTALRNAG